MRHSRTQVCVDGVPVFRGFDIIKSYNCYFTVNDKQSFINMIFYPLPFTNIVFIYRLLCKSCYKTGKKALISHWVQYPTLQPGWFNKIQAGAGDVFESVP